MTYRTKIRGGQIAVPTRLRRLAGLAEGDLLDVTVERGKLTVASTGSRKPGPATVAPKQTIKQRRDEFLEQLRSSAPESLKKIWAESERKGTDKMSLRQINSVIAASRKEKRQKQESATIPAR
jgi:bifunctional DNA-binding transcriptional regulator/antitoxin component of YhaV-PrlF toxin-antitoxin module